MLAFRVHKDETETAAPVVFIHGAMGNKLIWLMLSRRLAKALPGRTHFLVDLPGHGESGGSGYDSIENYAESVAEFMDAQSIARATVVGHSMGGAVAQQLALDFSDRIQSLVLIATGARLGVAPPIFEALKSDFDGAVTMMRDFVFGPDSPDAIVNPAIDQMGQVGPETALGDFSACNNFDSRDRIGSIKARALVCCGELDRMTPAKGNRKLAALLNAPYSEFAKAGHMLPLEKPAELSRAVAEFLTVKKPA